MGLAPGAMKSNSLVIVGILDGLADWPVTTPRRFMKSGPMR